MGSCQNCDRCTASAISRFGRRLAAVGTLGMTELAIGVGELFKRTCQTCKHPLGMHEGARICIMNQAPPTVAVPMPVPHPIYIPLPAAPMQLGTPSAQARLPGRNERLGHLVGWRVARGHRG